MLNLAVPSILWLYLSWMIYIPDGFVKVNNKSCACVTTKNRFTLRKSEIFFTHYIRNIRSSVYRLILFARLGIPSPFIPGFSVLDKNDSYAKPVCEVMIRRYRTLAIAKQGQT
jgi:hypothetical protein